MGYHAGVSRCTLLGTAMLALACASEREADASREASSASPSAPTALSAAQPEPSAALSSTPIGAAIVPPAPVTAAGRVCRQQAPQDFLLRQGQIAKIGASKEERAAIQAARTRANDYRTRYYGYVSGFGSRADNSLPPRHFAQKMKFMGLPLVMHRKVVPALECVEAALRRDCAAEAYEPRRMSGIRIENTFKDYEVSNHLYGIALDIDSHLNPCCKCVGRWKEAEACRKKVSSPFERMAMPKCWVEVFERYGFHWLGHDPELEDTMHFEFLGDPEKILE